MSVQNMRCLFPALRMNTCATRVQFRPAVQRFPSFIRSYADSSAASIPGTANPAAGASTASTSNSREELGDITNDRAREPFQRGNRTNSNNTSSSSNSNNNSQRPPAPTRLMKRVLHVRRVARVNSGGKVRSVSALVVVGNGNGAAGYGEGRAVEAAAAVLKATRNAEKNMTSFYRFNNRTIFNNIDFNWHKVRLQLRSAPPGYGVVANNHIHEICRCIGISDLGAKVHGSRNPLNVIKATFEALHRQRRPEDIARARGSKVMDVELTYYGHTDKSNSKP
ncbi:hypothetical protein PhCBS80983_g01575 [Powellomyces hirtus]|uniref:S5 DRBM domain-containing protein n=1 Tax=Powellomyces hirtus TaxID=109895 RepID=A0A507EA57_9FUNG|nr:hypothetical protein PhCBS80983_g01575 [Powellomyces hirtus]